MIEVIAYSYLGLVFIIVILKIISIYFEVKAEMKKEEKAEEYIHGNEGRIVRAEVWFMKNYKRYLKATCLVNKAHYKREAKRHFKRMTKLIKELEVK